MSRKLKLFVRNAVTVGSLPALKIMPVAEWPPLFGRLQGIHVPRLVVPSPTKTPAGGVNIKIVFNLLARCREIDGAVAECGVYRGATLIPMALYLKQHGIEKTVYGFDSFEGFDESVSIDIGLGGRDIFSKHVGGLGDTSYEELMQKIARFGLSPRIALIKGYFRETLARCADRCFSFVHLDCDLYQSYKDCLEFFYPRLNRGAIVLFDEYNDPPWPGCNKAVDEFLAGKPEKVTEIAMDNYQKWYFKKQ